MFNGNQMRGIQQIQLNATHGTTKIVSLQDISAKTLIADLALNLLQHDAARTGWYVLDFFFGWLIGNRRQDFEVFGMAGNAMKVFQFLHIGCKKIGAKSDRDFVITP